MDIAEQIINNGGIIHSEEFKPLRLKLVFVEMKDDSPNYDLLDYPRSFIPTIISTEVFLNHHFIGETETIILN